MSESLKACKQKECNVSVDGVCMEAIKLDDCPHFYFRLPSGEAKFEIQEDEEDQEDEEETKDEVAPNKHDDSMSLYSGEPFTIENLTSFTGGTACKSIYILGGPECGKTTLIVTIYDLLQQGPFNDILFAGSHTLVGAERRSHLSHEISGSLDPDTERTFTRQFEFLHLSLKLKGSENHPATNLLLSDINGEKIRDSMNTNATMSELERIKYAHRVVYIVDGELLGDVRQSLIVHYDVKLFIKRAIDCKVFVPTTDLKIVISKADKLNDIDVHAKKLFDMLEKAFKDKVGKLSFSCIAARPIPNKLGIKMGEGVYDLVKDWMQDNLLAAPKYERIRIKTSNRSFNRFTTKPRLNGE
ncbi:hypothetical protein SAMN05660909_05609 [Chitinophaga terrae (ex Kim and Jung 2007)]|uniref:Double-GTPase 2 domain-containing protein n=1 Tax=Chitinophaga terrae (ex Kim and Jung 2007) TaxID=408074 RepID=A0A1H4GQ57_9BACT|nr:hypothetical protein [Chitinophaga terrae (ex Kim and Jung 2007)]GEP93664.1 hypothetical protein CTE07_53090 [Chitinophaga terrae (ex Kim and Jung 2007)]SEB11723.1 hypothetical protein SAMN05660909_05609 [Chitinophaga terrae (ex Kim and Jung 2007)]